MKIFRTTLFLLIPFLAMTEGGAMYQRLVNVPLWISDMNLMKEFHGVGFYFFYFTPPVLILWLTMVISGWKYNGRGKILLRINHIFYFSIILSTALYFIPFLGRYVGNTEAIITNVDIEQLKIWAFFSMIRQMLGFIVIGIYVFMLGVVNKDQLNKSMKNYSVILLIAFVALSSFDKTPYPDGEKLYEANCLRCHSADGKKGSLGAGKLIQSKLDDAAVTLTIQTENASCLLSKIDRRRNKIFGYLY